MLNKQNLHLILKTYFNIKNKIKTYVLILKHIRICLILNIFRIRLKHILKQNNKFLFGITWMIQKVTKKTKITFISTPREYVLLKI